MRTGLRLGFAVAGMLALGVPAAAESRVFIIANHADGYGVDRCLANGERCGVTVATAYVFSPEVRWVGSYLNRSGSFVQALQMGS